MSDENHPYGDPGTWPAAETPTAGKCSECGRPIFYGARFLYRGLGRSPLMVCIWCAK